MELLEDEKKRGGSFHKGATRPEERDIFRLDAERQPVAAPNYIFDCNKNKTKKPSDAKLFCIKMEKIIRNLVLRCPTAAKRPRNSRNPGIQAAPAE